MRAKNLYVLGAVVVTLGALLVYAPRLFLEYRYRAFIAAKQGTLRSADGKVPANASMVATWRSTSFGWKTSYACDAQTVVHPDASGNFEIPKAPPQADVSKLWFSRALGLDVEFDLDLFVYAPAQFPLTATSPGIAHTGNPWTVSATDVRSASPDAYSIKLEPAASDPHAALTYYASNLPHLSCESHEAPEVAGIEHKARTEALQILCGAGDPASVDKVLASKILARPVGLISLSGAQSPTIDLRSLCASANNESVHE